MNKASDSVIRNRLADKCLDKSELLIPMLNEDDRDRGLALAFEMLSHAKDSPKFQAAYDALEDIKNAAIEQYIGEHEAAEYHEWITEMREAEGDARADERRAA